MLSYWQKIKQRQCIGAATPIHLRRWYKHLHNGPGSAPQDQYTLFCFKTQGSPFLRAANSVYLSTRHRVGFALHGVLFSNTTRR